MEIRILKICFIAAIILFGSAVEASACTCLLTKLRKADVIHARSEAASVFIGRVLEIRKHEKVVGSETRTTFESIFEVSRAWKGVVQKRVRVFTGADSAMCGTSYEIGREYLVYGGRSEEKDVFSDHLCSRTRLATGDEFLKELKYLGKTNYSSTVKG